MQDDERLEELADEVTARIRARLERGEIYAKHARHHGKGGMDPVVIPQVAGGSNGGPGAVSTDVAQAAHSHTVSVDTPVGLSDANQEGTASAVARADHVHKRSVRVKSGIDNYVRNALDISGLQVADNAVDDEIEIVHDASSAGHHAQVHGASDHEPQSDAEAIHDNVAGEIAALPEKTAPAATDVLLIEDSAAGNAKKKVQVGNLPGGGGGTGGHQIQEDGTALPQRTGLNFAAGLIASDNQASDRTDVNLDYGVNDDLSNVDASAPAAGSRSRVARADHKHRASVAAPVDLGDANAAGSATALARADHVHRRTVRVKSGTSDLVRNALNVSGLGVADDATNDEVDIVHDASSAGHHAQAHDIDGADHTGTLDIGDAQLPAPPAGYAADVAAAGADGTSTRVARADHVHAHGSGYLPDAHHPRAHDHSAAADGNTLSPAVLNLPQAATPSQTVEGQVVWDSTNDKLTVGDGTGRKVMAREDQAVMDGDAAGGELTGTYPNPAVATVHAGSAHHAQVHAIDGSDHTGTLDIGDPQLPAPPSGYPADVAAASADGTSARVARADHVHAHGTGYLPDAHHPQAHGDDDHTGPSRVQVQDDGVAVAARTTLNFVGDGVTVSDDAQNGRINITIPGGGGGGGLEAHAIDGADHTGTLDIGDAQLPAPPTGYAADVAATKGDGTSTRVARADHVHAHGTGYLPDAHHPQAHSDADHTGPSRIEVRDEGTTVGTRAVLNFTGTGVRATDNAQAGRVDIEVPGSATIQLLLDGGGSAITTGLKAYVEVPFDCTVTGWTVVADQTGSIQIDVWRSTYAGFPPTSANSIAGTLKPTLSSQQKNQNLNLTTWTTSLARGDWLAFNVDSASTVQLVTLSLRVERA